MSFPGQQPRAVFSGALGDNSTGSYHPAQAEVSNGLVTLWIGSPSGWTQYFSVPATQVTVKSAAQRITLVVGGQNYPILAHPRAVSRALGYGVAGTAASVLNKPVYGAGVDVGRAVNQAAAAHAWSAGGGPQFVAAARQAGANVSRIGYGSIAAIAGGAALAVVFLAVILALALGGS